MRADPKDNPSVLMRGRGSPKTLEQHQSDLHGTGGYWIFRDRCTGTGQYRIYRDIETQQALDCHPGINPVLEGWRNLGNEGAPVEGERFREGGIEMIEFSKVDGMFPG